MDLTIHPFYSIEETANILGCKDTDIVKFGADGKLDLCIYFSGRIAAQDILYDEQTGESDLEWSGGPDEVSRVLLPMAEHHLLDLYRQISEKGNTSAGIPFHQFKQKGNTIKTVVTCSGIPVSKKRPMISHSDLYVKTKDLIRFIESEDIQIDEASGYTLSWQMPGLDGLRPKRAELSKLTGERESAAEADRSFGRAKANESPPSQPSTESEQDQGTNCENFTRSLRFSYENESEVKIQQPKKKAKIFTHDSLGFARADTKEWKSFRRVIEGADHFYVVGSTKDDKSYGSNMKRLQMINKKLIAHYLEKECRRQVPKNFKIYEKAPEEASGVYRFIFLVGDDARKYEHTDDSKEKWWVKINRLIDRYKMLSDMESDPETYSLQRKIQEMATEAISTRLVQSEEIRDLLQENKIFDPPEIDEYERYKHGADLDGITVKGAPLINNPNHQ